jgi:hypothetical protein
MKNHPRIAVCDPNEISLGHRASSKTTDSRSSGSRAVTPRPLLGRGLDVLCRRRGARVRRLVSARDAGCVVIGTGTTAGGELAFAGLRAGAVGYLTRTCRPRLS